MPEPEDETTPAAVHSDAATADEASSDALSTEASLPDEELLGAVELARAALLEITTADTIGDPAGHLVEGENAVSLLFQATMTGYPGWFWTVSVGRVAGEEPTVLEAELMPGDDALLAPEWVPWSDRLADLAAQESDDDESDDDDDDSDDDDDDSDDDDDDASDDDEDDDDDDESDDDDDESDDEPDYDYDDDVDIDVFGDESPAADEEDDAVSSGATPHDLDDDDADDADHAPDDAGEQPPAVGVDGVAQAQHDDESE